MAQTGRSTRSAPSTVSRQQPPASLAKRLLFPHLPPGADLPPLFLSEACPRELHDEAYDLTALALRAFVNTWWTKLTRYDKEFLPQIASIVSHVVRALERRLLDADLALLVYGDIPALVAQHYRDYRQAASKVSTSYATGGALSLPQLFHQLQPHMAISSDGTLDEEYFRQALDHVLRECLPAEDYAPEAERFIAREIMLKVVVKDVIPRMSQPWFLQKTVLDMLGPSSDVLPEQPSAASGSVRGQWTKSSVIVLLLSAIQRLSGACITLIHAYKQVVYIIPIVNQTSCSTRDASVSGTPSVSPSQSARSSPLGVRETNLGPPDLARGLLEMISEVLRVQDGLAAAALVQFLALVCRAFQTFTNKLLCYVLYSHVLSASTVLYAVRASKRTLFPNGYPGPPPVDPTREEQTAIRDAVVKRLRERVPALGRSVEGAVEGLSDEACNRHLGVVVVDAVLRSAFPGMGS